MENLPRLLDVVVATDGSADAELAVDWAAAEAMRRSASLLILSAYLPDRAHTEASNGALDIVDLAADRARRHFPGLAVQTKIVEGDPRDALVEFQDRASLVVLGSRGLNALRTVWLGSVSYWAARNLRVPTVIVRPLRHQGVRRNVAVGIDSRAAAPTLMAALEMAAHRHCRVTVGHAWWDVEGPNERWTAVDADAVESARRHLVNDLVREAAAQYPDAACDVVFGRGSVVAFLLDLARSHDVLFVGRRRTAPFDPSGLGTIATAVVEHAHGATVVVPTIAGDSNRR